jgi:hypothetical protein
MVRGVRKQIYEAPMPKDQVRWGQIPGEEHPYIFFQIGELLRRDCFALFIDGLVVFLKNG